MKKFNYYLLALILIYISILVIWHRDILTYKFQPSLVGRYLHSQDIVQDDLKGRVFLSDSDIHIASGYLYSQGNNPIKYNFQHPPFIKYLFGTSIQFFGNPLFIQVILGGIFCAFIFILGTRMTKNSTIGFLAAILTMIDPVFWHVTELALLDLGQAVGILIYIYLVLYHPKKYIFRGIVLGLTCASKFWAPPLYFYLALFIRDFVRKKIELKSFFYELLIAIIIFATVYMKTFIDDKFMFNIVIFELKVIKYWIHHSVSTVPGSELILFLSGYISSWWGSKSIIRSDVWSIFWPISFIASLIFLARYKYFKRNFQDLIIMTLIITIYLFYMSLQAPFVRYLIVVIPFFYIASLSLLFLRVKKDKN